MCSKVRTATCRQKQNLAPQSTSWHHVHLWNVQVMLSESGSALYACMIVTKLPEGLFGEAAHVQAKKLVLCRRLHHPNKWSRAMIELLGCQGLRHLNLVCFASSWIWIWLCFWLKRSLAAVHPVIHTCLLWCWCHFAVLMICSLAKHAKHPFFEHLMTHVAAST